MTKFLEPKKDFGPLYRIIDKAFHAPLLVTAINLEVFDKISTQVSAQNLSAQAGWHPENTEFFLNALVAAGLLEKKEGEFYNTDLSRTFLLKSSSAYLGDMLVQNFYMYAQNPSTLGELIQQGPQKLQAKTDNMEPDPEIFAEQSVPIIASVELAGYAHLAASIVSDLPEFPGMKHMLDLGGGPGLNCMAIVSAHPSMKGTIFDFPSVIRKTNDYIQDYGMDDRITTLGGDLTQDDLGSGYDLILAAGVLNFSKDYLDRVMAKIYKALARGGICISVHEHLTPDGTGPGISVRRYLPMALSGTDFYLESGTMANAMKKAGFQPDVSQIVESPMGPLVLDIGRVP